MGKQDEIIKPTDHVKWPTGLFNKVLRLLGVFALILPIIAHAAPASPLVVSQFPLQISTIFHPKVLFAISNSESMDGTVSGAIMTGSGALTSGFITLYNSSSPVNYTVPAGFTPPKQGPDANGLAPYTTSQGGTVFDNGPSRLNVAKGGINTVIDTYMPNTDFAIAAYKLSNISLYRTWVYYATDSSGAFSFSNTQDSSSRYVANPCYDYTNASSTIQSNCNAMTPLYGATTLSTNKYMKIGASSDDSDINDVLYAGSSLPGVFVTYSGPSPATPYPPNFSLSNYNSGSVFLQYQKTRPDIGSFGTGPTNAGYVPYSSQVMYAKRGFGYYAGQSATSGDIIIPMITAGNSPNASAVSTAKNKLIPFLKPETDNASTSEIKSAAVQSPIAGLLTTVQDFFKTQGNGNACKSDKFVVLITDGLPTQDLSGKVWPPLGSASATGYGVTATFNADGSLQTTNDQALTDAITVIGNLYKDEVKTYVLGLGAGVDPTLNPQAASSLTAMAVAGKTINYYAASNPQAFLNALNNIIVALHVGTFATTAASVSSTNLQTAAIEYQSSFTIKDYPYLDWTGNLIAMKLDPATGAPTGTTIWSAQTLLDTKSDSSRLIATWNPALNSGTGAGAPFTWTDISATQQGLLQPSDSLGENRLLYIRGNTTLEQRNGGTFRNRTHLLGDIVDSKPAFVGSPLSQYIVSSASYLQFALAQASRLPMLYVGANDGMLHAFNATTGVEQFAFVPNGVFANLMNIPSPLYNESHLFFVDGSPQSADVQFSDASWHTILVGGEAGGGSSIYAIDVTSPSTLTTESKVAAAVLWEFTDADMGLSYSEPQIAQISTSSTSSLRFAVFFGNGYNSPNNKDILYAVNPQTGQTLAKIDLCAAVANSCDSNTPNGLSTVAFGQGDGFQTAPITRVYAGDLQGNLWAVDVSNSNPAAWSVRLLMQARTSNGKIQSITTPPIVTLNPNYPRSLGMFVIFGTGSLLSQNDLSNTDTQSIYGVWDNPAKTVTLSRSTLQSQTLTLVTAQSSGLPQDILTSTNNSINWATQSGWYVDLPIAGQRVITNPGLVNGSFIATLNTPPLKTCDNPSSMFLMISYQNGGDGGGGSSPQLDINADKTINSKDKYNGSNPVGLGLSNAYASAPVTLGPNNAGYLTQLITLSTGQQLSVINPNNTKRQSSWWQIQ
jgi:type IV pilus assembly protein PilY1